MEKILYRYLIKLYIKAFIINNISMSKLIYIEKLIKFRKKSIKIYYFNNNCK